MRKQISGLRLLRFFFHRIILLCLVNAISVKADEHGFRFLSGQPLPVEISQDSSVVLELDLAAFDENETLYAGIRFRASLAENDLSVPLLGLFDSKSNEMIAQAFIHLGKPRYYTYDLTDYINTYLDKDEKYARILIAPVGGFDESFTITLSRVQFYLGDKVAHTLSIDQMTTPFWKSGEVWGETVFPNQVRLPLLAEPGSKPDVYNGLRTTAYTEDDFFVKDDKLLLAYQMADRVISNSVLYPKDKVSAKGRVFKSRKGGFLLGPEGTWFQKRQLSVDYSFDPDTWRGPKPEFEPELLPRTLEKLKKKEPLKVVFYGDSITMGANATAVVGEPPYQWSWSTLIIEALRSRYDGTIEWINAALGGTTAEWGQKNAEALLAPYEPDLVVIAFGMNGSITPKDFGQMVESMMGTVRAVNPEAEFILVHAMQPNSDWKGLSLYQKYGAVMKKLQQPGVLFADVWSMHEALIERKRYVDMTANHVNHPNDFLIRIYAQVILSRFVDFE